MRTKHLFLTCITASLLILGFASCSDSDNDEKITEANISNAGIFVLNSGKQGSNNASLTFYDFSAMKTIDKAFAKTNGKSLGDTGQDMLVYGSKIFIAVYESNVIFITDRLGKIVGEIKPTNNGQPQGPRNLTGYEGKVYATLYDGYLAKIDTTELKIEKQVKVGRNPEYVKAANNKLYVANSGGMDYNTAIGYDKTVSVVDIATFTEKKQIPVVINPVILSAPNSNGDIYLISNGNYKDVPNTLQKINSTTDVVTTLTDINGTWMSMNHDNLYLIYSQYDENWNQKISYLVYDTKTEKLITDNFITDGTAVEKPYSISTDPVNNYVYISTSDYKTNGNMFIFTSAGKLVSKFDTGGLNPMGAYYVSAVK